MSTMALRGVSQLPQLPRGRSAMQQERMKDVLVQMIVNEVAQSESWKEAAQGSAAMRAGLHELASQAVAHVCSEPKMCNDGPRSPRACRW